MLSLVLAVIVIVLAIVDCYAVDELRQVRNHIEGERTISPVSLGTRSVTQVFNSPSVINASVVTLLLYDSNEDQLLATITRPTRARPLTVLHEGKQFSAVRETVDGRWIYRREAA